MESRSIDARVEQDIGEGVRRDIDSRIQKDLGTNLGLDTTLAVRRTETVHPLIQALRNPQGVRQAILMAEILNRPKSMR
jgi:glucuronate isomerase